MDMLRNVYGNRIKIVPFKDLGLTEVTNAWCDYVLDKLHKLGMPTPNYYYTGSIADSIWYKDHFKNNVVIVDRNQNNVPSASELRTFLQLRDNGWRGWIPRVNWTIVDEQFPNDLRVLTGE
jgi:hypothetical protein